MPLRCCPPVVLVWQVPQCASLCRGPCDFLLEGGIGRVFLCAEFPGGQSFVGLPNFLVFVAEHHVGLGELRGRRHGFLLVNEAGQALDSLIIGLRISRPIIQGRVFDKLGFPVFGVYLQSGVKCLIRLQGQQADLVVVASIGFENTDFIVIAGLLYNSGDKSPMGEER